MVQVNICQKFLFLHQLTLTNQQYDERLFIELRVQYIKNCKLRTCCVHKLFLVLTFRTIYVHNMFWACNFDVCNEFVIQWTMFCYIELDDARISASKEDLPLRWNFDHLDFLQPMTSHSTVLWLVKSSVDGQNFVVPSYARKPVTKINYVPTQYA